MDVRIKIECRWCSESRRYSIDAVKVIRYSHGLFGYEYFCQSCHVYDCRPTSFESASELMQGGCSSRPVMVAGEFFDEDVRQAKNNSMAGPVSAMWIGWWVSKYLTEEASLLMEAELTALELKDMGDDNERSRP